MKRTVEKVLSIISVALTGIAVLLSFLFLSAYKTFNSDKGLLEEFEMSLRSDQTLSPEQADLILSMVDVIETFNWFIIVILLISLITTIVGITFIWNNKKPKLAGAMFFIGGLFAVIFSPTSILLYIAGILCFVRKPTQQGEQKFVKDDYGETMRPL